MRTQSMTALAAGLFCLCAAAPAAAADVPALGCRAQVIAHCDTKCEFGAGPADISLDPAKGTVSYCRGEQCDEGRIAVARQQGQWNDEPYASFDGETERGGRIWGLVSLKSLTFYARGDVGDMFGSCEPG
jgi:hypothetical protein